MPIGSLSTLYKHAISRLRLDISRSITSLQFTAKRAPILILVVLMLAVAPAASKAGLFGKMAEGLGIRGSVGKTLGKVDGALFGGSGPADTILGSVGASAAGDAIKNWKSANLATIEKLGQTNDATVDRLVTGLGNVQSDLNAGISDNIESIAINLESSIASLDSVLQLSIDRLDASLNNQTGRLDIIFQKQTSTIFFLGKMILVVAVLSSAFYLIASALGAQKASKTLLGVIKATRWRTLPVAALAAILVWATSALPDPTGIRSLRDRLVDGYYAAMAVQDFGGANYHAARLAVVEANDSLVSQYEIKSRALRDAFLRPTILMSRDNLTEILGRLSRADGYYLDEFGDNDPEISAVIGILYAQSASSNIDVLRALVYADYADEWYRGNSEGGQRRLLKDAPQEFEQKNRALYEEISRRSIAYLAQVPLSAILMKMAATGESANDELETLLGKLSVQAQPRQTTADANEALHRIPPLSPFAQTLDSIESRVSVIKMYRKLTANYLALQRVRITGLNENNNEFRFAVCSMYKDYDDWYNSEFTKRAGDTVLISNLIAGPFQILERVYAQLSNKNLCQDSHYITKDKLLQLSNASEQWLRYLEDRPFVSARGLVRIRNLRDGLRQRQIAAFDEFEKITKEMHQYESLNAGQDSVTRDLRNSVRTQWLSAATLLGLFAKSNDGRVVPVAEAAYAWTGYKADLGETAWQQIAWQYVHQSKL